MLVELSRPAEDGPSNSNPLIRSQKRHGNGGYDPEVSATSEPVAAAPEKGRFSALWREVRAFGIIGVLNTVIDFGLFNILIAGPLSNKVTTAKIIASLVATVFAWIGNRLWTYKERENRPAHHEFLLFVLVNGLAIAVTAGWVAIAHYWLHAHGTFWINFHALLGTALGTILRFLAYRYVVFNKPGQAG